MGRTSRPVRFWTSCRRRSISAPLRPMMMPGRAVWIVILSLLPGRSISIEATPAAWSWLFSRFLILRSS